MWRRSSTVMHCYYLGMQCALAECYSPFDGCCPLVQAAVDADRTVTYDDLTISEVGLVPSRCHTLVLRYSLSLTLHLSA